MAITFVKIAAITLSSNNLTLTFSSIPATYTDLYLTVSGRTNDSTSETTSSITINSSTSTFSTQAFQFTGGGNGSSTQTARRVAWIPGATATANFFHNQGIYFPNYSNSSNNKNFMSDSVQGNNQQTAYIYQSAHLWATTNAINEIILRVDGASKSWVTNTTATLYGIKTN